MPRVIRKDYTVTKIVKNHQFAIYKIMTNEVSSVTYRNNIEKPKKFFTLQYINKGLFDCSISDVENEGSNPVQLQSVHEFDANTVNVVLKNVEKDVTVELHLHTSSMTHDPARSEITADTFVQSLQKILQKYPAAHNDLQLRLV
tara:strand:- start:604 stop:1035 length:432 start_codon:yes stop_codon:yes gene_type:complete